VIGPGRGIEDAVAAVEMLDVPVELHLRGTLDPSFASHVIGRPRVVMLPQIPPPELVARAAEHDIGLALEQPVTENRALCVTNKLFTYMLAGLAVGATDTVGQREILKEAPGAGFLYPAGQPAALAAGIRRLLTDKDELAKTKAAAWNAADGRFNWEYESRGLVSYLEDG
jgi:glycosyltransferase involved in cell wall biosynthesis